jgi:hypothetical protein
MTNYHLAQVNIARMRTPLNDPIMQGFVSQLDTINALAEASQGFIWRLATPAGDATSLRVFPDEWLIINMSVWESIESLWNFTYEVQHAGVMAGRKQWFEKLDYPYLALWWIPVGTEPTLEDAKARLEHLRDHGATNYAFTFKQRFAAGDGASTER